MQPAFTSKRFAHLECECGYTADIPLLDNLGRDKAVGDAYEEHRQVCPVQGPIIEEARALVLKLERELLPRLGFHEPIAVFGLGKLLGIDPAPLDAALSKP